MLLWEILLIAFSLCFDSLALAITCGLETKNDRLRKMGQIAVVFATVQATTPIIGYFAGLILERFITGVDHWIPFGLLSVIGGNMIVESLKERKEQRKTGNQVPVACKEITFAMMCVMGLATSIDALMVGVTFAFLAVNIWFASLVFWIVTAGVVIIGFLIGNRVGDFFKNGTAIVGGIILIGLGVKILLEDLLAN